jgi:hypothetical protein
VIYAARLKDEWATRKGNPRSAERIVLVEAASPENAQAQSGMVQEPFRAATSADLEEWADACDQPLTDHEVEALIRLARRAARSAGQRRAKRGELPGFDMDAARAAMLNLVVGKLSRMKGVESDDGSY